MDVKHHDLLRGLQHVYTPNQTHPVHRCAYRHTAGSYGTVGESAGC